MKILILSCHTGAGHDTAAHAVEEEFQRQGTSCIFADALSFAGPKTSKIISGSYMGIAAHAPRFFHGLYKAGSAISSSSRKSPVYHANRLYAKRLATYIAAQDFSCVVTSHLFAAEALTFLRRTHALSCPCWSIATDYTCIPFWEETELSGSFIPHPDLLPEYTDKQMDPEKLIPLGIPVSHRFTQRLDQKAARAKLGLSETGNLFLIMTGSMGFGSTLRLTEELAARCDDHDMIRVLCGRNKRLFLQINHHFSGDRRVQPLSFTEKIPLLMDAANVLLTKPGGLTSTEAAVHTIPLILTDPIPGCETKNALFFARHGMAICTQGPVDAAAAAIALVGDENRCRAMTDAQRNTINPNAAADICSYILQRL